MHQFRSYKHFLGLLPAKHFPLIVKSPLLLSLTSSLSTSHFSNYHSCPTFSFSYVSFIFIFIVFTTLQNYTKYVGKKCTFRLLNRGSAKALDKVAELDGMNIEWQLFIHFHFTMIAAC